ncbi:hypothetical protein HZC07_03265, partial [Candidatus Micrarchaeota archaeon]|nr:hypothetical protein [Candidatus Micrarchaeota archaeon]
MPTHRRISTFPPRKVCHSVLSKMGLSFDSPDIIDEILEQRIQRTSTHKDVLTQLSQPHQDLVLVVLRKSGNCTHDLVKELVALDPAVRELRFRNYLAAVWTDGDWKNHLSADQEGKYIDRASLIATEMSALTKAMSELESILNLKRPTQADKAKALQSELSENQKTFIRLMPDCSRPITQI